MNCKKEISHLKKREIQAPIVKAILEGFIDEFGEEKSLEVLSKIIEKDAIKSGKELAQVYCGGEINDLAQMINEVWCQEGAMEMEVLKQNENEFHFNVNRCLYAEVYKKLNMEKLGKCLSCNRDFPFNNGFNPKIKLVRTKTIMEGHEICDFKYYKNK